MTSADVVPQMISADASHYIKSFKVFKDGNNMQEMKLQLLKTLVPKVVHHAISTDPSQRTFSILGVGTSKGEMDFPMLEAALGTDILKSKTEKPAIYNRIVEPSSEAISAYKDLANEWIKTSKAEVNFEWVQSTFQEYQTNHTHEPNQFQLIHFVGSIYYVDPEEALRYCLEKELASNGVIIVTCLAEDSCLVQYERKFHDTGVAPFPPGYLVFTINRIKEIAEKNNWRYEYFETSWYQDISVLDSPESRESKLLIDFVTHTINFQSVRGMEVAEKVRQSTIASSQLKPDGKRVIDDNKYGGVLIYSS